MTKRKKRVQNKKPLSKENGFRDLDNLVGVRWLSYFLWESYGILWFCLLFILCRRACCFFCFFLFYSIPFGEWKKFLAYIVFCSFLFSNIAIIHVWHGDKQWAAFKQQYHCKVMDKADGYPLNAEYGKTAYRCSNNFIYWRWVILSKYRYWLSE